MLLYLVQCCMVWVCGASACAVLAGKPALKLVTDEAVHPIRRHYTSSVRVYRDGSGAALHGMGLLDAGMCSATE